MLFLRWNLHASSPTGQQVSWPGSGLVRFEGDHVVSSETFFDYLSLLKQLQMIPARVWQTLLRHGVVRGEVLRPDQRWLVRQGPELCQRRIVLMPGAVLRDGTIHKALEALERLVPLGVLVPSCATVQDDQQSEFLLEGSDFGILIVDGQDRILEANRTFLRLLGEPIECVVGSLVGDWLSTTEPPAQEALLYPTRVRLNGFPLDLWTSRLEQPGGPELFLRVFREPARELLEKVVQQHEIQREFLAYDLHDGLAQDLASLWVSLQTEDLLARRKGQPGHDPQLQQVQGMLREIRTMLRELRNPFKHGAGLTEALQEWADCQGLEIRLELDAFEPLTNLLLYRLITEALGLLLPISSASLGVRRGEGVISALVQVEVPAHPSGEQLHRLRLRCESLQGQLQLVHQPGGTSSLHLSLADPEALEWGAIGKRTQ